ncbi:MAG: hypothetical protein AUJ92_01785 [Armatimonadetes bacterium CG2_30_59_28]|nr:MAG: hypothetical protein AUJ92_01785 [Armatimonadetes bacterium CG2_30_59_28]
MTITFLGTGTSHGVPRIGCDCDVCVSTDPRNKRFRSSILVNAENSHLVVDTTPDFRTQALRHKLRSLDAILFTHAHADHLNGMDDIRCLCPRGGLPCYASPDTLQQVCAHFDYAVREDLNLPGMPRITPVPVDNLFNVGSLRITPFDIRHGRITITAFRFEDAQGRAFVYATDCSEIPARSERHFHELDLLILGALRHRPHPCHFNVEQAVEITSRFQPAKTLLVHIDHDLDHALTNSQLPSGVELSYDGLIVEV